MLRLLILMSSCPFSVTGVPDLDFEKAMRVEHCSKSGADHEFETSNYHLKTNSRREWSIVVNNEPLKPEEEVHGRKIPDLENLLQLPISIKANIMRIEIISMVLYTGPMVCSHYLNPVHVRNRDGSCFDSSWSTTRYYGEPQSNCTKSLKIHEINFQQQFMFSSRPW